jgi:hypothetical protein
MRKQAPINYDEKIDKEYRGEITPDGQPVRRPGGETPQTA